MSNLICIASEMNKVAQLSINVNYRRPGNVVGYLPVEFEVFRDGHSYKAIPLQDFQTRILTSLPGELLFKIKDGKVLSCSARQEVAEIIVNELIEKNLVEKPSKRLTEDLAY